MLTDSSKARHAQLQSLSKDQPTAGDNSGECAICLGAVLVSALWISNRLILLTIAAMPITFRGSLCPCLALQMH